MEHDDLLVHTQMLTATPNAWRVSFDSVRMAGAGNMVRVSTDVFTQTILTQQQWEADEFMHGAVMWVNERAAEVGLLTCFAAWQKRKLDYDGVYAAWLLEATTEEEFVEEAKKFAVILTEKDPQYMVQVAEKLVSLLPFELTTADLAEFLQTEPRALLDAIAHFGESSEKLRALLPQHKLELNNE
jgi:hypothetical protein